MTVSFNEDVFLDRLSSLPWGGNLWMDITTAPLYKWQRVVRRMNRPDQDMLPVFQSLLESELGISGYIGVGDVDLAYCLKEAYKK